MAEAQMLQLYLWDMRAQVEAQLRRLTDVQRLLDTIGQPSSDSGAQKDRIHKDLSAILAANAAIADVSAAALEVAHAL